MNSPQEHTRGKYRLFPRGFLWPQMIVMQARNLASGGHVGYLVLVKLTSHDCGEKSLRVRHALSKQHTEENPCAIN
jgi:hypothetical protein